ncbi:hypothetical protein LWI29_028827 [Acer saccharum]|uniref:FAD-binding domain-containing protein n=1 Tax=Acer saccharum TaxID=4024 RepID=A0AA39SM16_ACESA|nr:hypothetical protein LWI29_028827 [Acer saccharum]
MGSPLMFRLPWDIVFGNLTKGNITLAGDATHPMTPDIAQGGCAALEDAVVLWRHIGKMLARDGGRLVPSNIPRALDGYVKERRWHVALLVASSYNITLDSKRISMVDEILCRGDFLWYLHSSDC